MNDSSPVSRTANLNLVTTQTLLLLHHIAPLPLPQAPMPLSSTTHHCTVPGHVTRKPQGPVTPCQRLNRRTEKDRDEVTLLRIRLCINSNNDEGIVWVVFAFFLSCEIPIMIVGFLALSHYSCHDHLSMNLWRYSG